jgi:hypothetical protein
MKSTPLPQSIINSQSNPLQIPGNSDLNDARLIASLSPAAKILAMALKDAAASIAATSPFFALNSPISPKPPAQVPGGSKADDQVKEE